ncbi:hypothetical protein C8R44DRAFT_859578 [Mycena epipterygia]|nr:hypothetical protein C8R44DRAFT_859578 [Mycena epipterygia]
MTSTPPADALDEAVRSIQAAKHSYEALGAQVASLKREVELLKGQVDGLKSEAAAATGLKSELARAREDASQLRKNADEAQAALERERQERENLQATLEAIEMMISPRRALPNTSAKPFGAVDKPADERPLKRVRVDGGANTHRDGIVPQNSGPKNEPTTANMVTLRGMPSLFRASPLTKGKPDQTAAKSVIVVRRPGQPPPPDIRDSSSPLFTPAPSNADVDMDGGSSQSPQHAPLVQQTGGGQEEDHLVQTSPGPSDTDCPECGARGEFDAPHMRTHPLSFTTANPVPKPKNKTIRFFRCEEDLMFHCYKECGKAFRSQSEMKGHIEDGCHQDHWVALASNRRLCANGRR